MENVTPVNFCSMNAVHLKAVKKANTGARGVKMLNLCTIRYGVTWSYFLSPLMLIKKYIDKKMKAKGY